MRYVKTKREKRLRRQRRSRAKVLGSKERPRLSVFRSNKHVYAQLISDEEGRTIVAASDREIKSQKSKIKKTKKTEPQGNPGVERAREVGKLIAEKAKKAGITKVVFHRGGYAYHGQVKALAEGAREGGLEF